ncbi:MAG: MoaD/ThiS family protein [Rhizobiaceae bacterium]|nr:MoaD/ThiS family protein [Rhizobiaceae bacterium]
MVAIKIWGGLSAATNGQTELEIDANYIRELFAKLEERYPGVKPYIERGIAVSIDGVIYRDTWSKELPDGAEIFLLPRLEGG